MAQGIVRVTPGATAGKLDVTTVDNPNPYGIRVGQSLNFNPTTFTVRVGDNVNFTALSSNTARVTSVLVPAGV